MKPVKQKSYYRANCINEDFTETSPEMTQKLVLGQWKIYVRSAEKISEQRQHFVNWFNGFNGLIVAAFAGILRFGDIDGLHVSLSFLKYFPPLIGIVISIITIFRIFVYRQRKKDKYTQIYILEQQLPFKVYTNEYKMRKRVKFMLFNLDLSSGTKLELLIPISFLTIYIIMFFWTIAG